MVLIVYLVCHMVARTVYLSYDSHYYYGQSGCFCHFGVPGFSCFVFSFLCCPIFSPPVATADALLAMVNTDLLLLPPPFAHPASRALQKYECLTFLRKE
jgi:hypothetical protein